MIESADPWGRGNKVDKEPRCWRCKKKVAESLTRPWHVKCVRCKAENYSEGSTPVG